MSKLIDRIKLIGIKRDFNKIYNLVLENSNRVTRKSFSDGTPYTEAELKRRITEIEDRIHQLKIPVKNDGLLYAIANSGVGFLELGIERLFQLYDKEPEYVKNVIIGTHRWSNEFLRSQYFNRYDKKMSIDKVLNDWFKITAVRIEVNGIHDFVYNRKSKMCDVSRYGESFIKEYPEFFLEDTNIPEKIKQKFYSADLRIDDYEDYREEFEKKIVGIGIPDCTDLDEVIGKRNYGELIKANSKAVKYFQDNPYGTNLDRRIYEFQELENIKSIRKKFYEIIEGEIEEVKKSVLKGRTDLLKIRDTEFLRESLPEFILDNNAPEELSEEFYDASLRLIDIDANPDWIKWLYGKDEIIKARMLDENTYDDWREVEAEELSPIVNEYMSLLYEDNLRYDIIDRKEIKEAAITDVFKERNQDIFCDDLPEHLRIHFENHDWGFEDFFALSMSDKNLLKNKRIEIAFPYGANKIFCQKYGGDFESFKIYEKYAGVLNLVVISVNKTFGCDSLEEMIKKCAIEEIKNGYISYDDRVVEEYKRENSEYFLDANAPIELKNIFYRKSSRKMTFEMLRDNPEYISFLEGKSIRQVFDANYRSFFDFCVTHEEAMKLGIKYGDYVEHLDFHQEEALVEDREKILVNKLYESIKNSSWDYRDLPENFKSQYPELFLLEEDLEKLKTLNDDEIGYIKQLFYNKSLNFGTMKKFPQLLDIMKTKDLGVISKGEAIYLLDLFKNKELVLELGVEYGNILLDEAFTSHCMENKYRFRITDPNTLLDELIYTVIINKRVSYDDELPERFQRDHKELFILSEELNELDDIEKALLKEEFYNKKIYLRDLKYNPTIKKIIFNKNLKICAENRGIILDEFTELLGDKEKAFNLITGKFAEKLDVVAESNDFENTLVKVVEYYKEAGFIPDIIIVDKLPIDKIKGFSLNKKLWRKIVEERGYVDSDILASLLEAAIVMGVFETKTFVREGKKMIQGSGEEGFKKLQKFLNYTPKYFKAPFNVDGELAVEYKGKGYIKEKGDFYEEIVYEKLEQAAKECDLLGEFIEELLDRYDVKDIINEAYPDESRYLDDFFEEDEEGIFHCTVDRNIDRKIKMMLKTLEIKEDRVLSGKECELISNCNEDYIKKGFRIIKEKESVSIGNVLSETQKVNKYKFNIFQIDGKFVIGEDYDIDEEQSRVNKRLFDYIKYLMLEHGLEGEALRLGANNDRSNIELVLSEPKMKKIAEAANKISQAALSKYSNKVDIWEVKKDIKTEYITDNVIHQVFDGLNMEYNKEFSDFLLDNIESIVEDYELLSRINSMQKKVIEISKDPDYIDQEITPGIVLRLINKIKFNDKKVGFEKGEELAQKFGFSQEYFEIAQEIWEEARKREASTIPRVQGQDGRCTYEVLRLDDATGIYAGNITNCCQKLGGAGETAMLHSMKEMHGRVFVVRDQNQRIIAQSWLWRNGDTMCFDNVEIPRNADSSENQDAIYDVLKKVAKELCIKDAEIVDRLVEEGKLDSKTGELIKVKKITVGQGNTDIDEIALNEDKELEDKENKSPIGAGEYYKGTTEEELYVSDSREQVILYKVEDYKREDEQPNIAIHCDENIEKKCLEISGAEFRMIQGIENEVEEVKEKSTIFDLAEKYNVKPEQLKVVLGTDWFMLYSEKDKDITVHKMLKSLSSGILKKSIREQRQAVKMLMDKGKTISMEFQNDRVHKAAKSMVRYMQERYTMKVADEENRISVSEIQSR